MSDVPPPTIPPATPPPPGGGPYTPPPPPGGGYTPGPASSDRTLMIVLSYLGLLALIPYFTKKDDPEVQWHAKNGVGLLIFDFVFIIALWVLGIVAANLPFGCGTGIIINCILPLALIALHVYCIIQAVGGKRPRIPVITDFAEKSF